MRVFELCNRSGIIVVLLREGPMSSNLASSSWSSCYAAWMKGLQTFTTMPCLGHTLFKELCKLSNLRMKLLISIKTYGTQVEIINDFKTIVTHDSGVISERLKEVRTCHRHEQQLKKECGSEKHCRVAASCGWWGQLQRPPSWVWTYYGQRWSCTNSTEF